MANRTPKGFRISRAKLCGIAALAVLVPTFANAQFGGESPLAKSMEIHQRLGDYVPKDVPLKDESGKAVKFGDMLQGRPVVLVPIFYRCQTGCSVLSEQILQTLARANKGANKLIVGRDLDIVMLSIHPKETPELAQSKKEFLLKAFEPPHATSEWWSTTRQGWHLLTGSYASIREVTNAIGFNYTYNERKDLINHPTCTVMLSPTGRISSYTIGNEFPTRVVEDDLVVAARNQIGVPADQSMMFGCIMLDPATHKYRVVIENVLRVACAAWLIFLIVWIASMSIKTKRAGQNGLGVSR